MKTVLALVAIAFLTSCGTAPTAVATIRNVPVVQPVWMTRAQNWG
jgi:uncharacterized lipoprotein YajG